MTTEFKNDYRLQKIERSMQDDAIGIANKWEGAKQYFDNGDYLTAKKAHDNMLQGIIDYLTEKLNDE